MPDFLDNTVYMDLVNARAYAFAALTTMSVPKSGVNQAPQPGKGLWIISLELIIEYNTLAIMKLDLQPDEKKQEALEVQFLMQAGLLKDARFQDLASDLNIGKGESNG